MAQSQGISNAGKDRHPKLSLRQRVGLLVLGYAKVGLYRKTSLGESGLEIFVAKCRIHGLYADYPHGFDRILRCAKCDREFFASKAEAGNFRKSAWASK